MNDLCRTRFVSLVHDMRLKQQRMLKFAKLGQTPAKQFLAELRDLERRVDVAVEKLLTPSLPFAEEGGAR